MNSDTLLYRMVSPSFLRDGLATSQAFRPSRKDNGRLSVYDGDQISPQAAYEHYASLGYQAVGVLAVSVAECESFNLTVALDPLPGFPEHTTIDFTTLSRKDIEIASRALRERANARRWQYRPTS